MELKLLNDFSKMDDRTFWIANRVLSLKGYVLLVVIYFVSSALSNLPV